MPAAARHSDRRRGSQRGSLLGAAASMALVLVVALSGFAATRVLGDTAVSARRADRSTLQDTLSGLGRQYLLVGLHDALVYASLHQWQFTPGSRSDTADLRDFTVDNPVASYGAELVSPGGRVLSSYGGHGPLPPVSEPAMVPMWSALKRGQPALSSVIAEGRHPIFALAVPVGTPSSPRAVLVGFAALWGTPLETYVSGLRQGRTGASYVVDSHGRVAAGPSSALGTVIPAAPALRQLAAGRTGIIDFSHRGTVEVAAYAPLGIDGWSGIDLQSRSEFEGSIESAVRTVDMLLAALLVVAAGSIAVYSRRRWASLRREAQWLRMLVDTRERLRSAFEDTPVGSAILDLSDGAGRIEEANPALGRLMEAPPDHLLGTSLLELIHPGDRQAVADAYQRLLAGDEGMFHLEVRGVRPDGRVLWCWVVGGLIRSEDGTARRGVAHIQDVSARKRAEQELTHQALHDSLTGLANRAHFTNRLSAVIAGGNRSSAAVLLLDLDQFKVINDSFGHSAGDAVLVAVAARLRGCLRPGDMVARLGGDEFTVLLEHMGAADDPELVSGRVIDALSEPIAVRGESVVPGASVGIALPGPGDTAEDVLRNADVAMYAAKAEGGNCAVRFRPAMQTEVRAEMALSADLRRAVADGQLVLHYQPYFDIASGRLEGAEALVRWQHPTRGLLGPAQFVPLAERTGEIVAIGRWVLEQACRQAVLWQASGHPHLSMSVNLSGRQLQSPTLIDDIAAVLGNTGIDPATVILEMTENVLVSDAEEMIRRLRRLKELGVELAVDDFGTGYSSLSYLSRFPIDVLKVDKTFVDGVDAEQTGLPLVRAIVELGRQLELRTVAEGVERQSQLRSIQGLGCHSAQGFLFSPPVSADGFADLLRAGSRTEMAAFPG